MSVSDVNNFKGRPSTLAKYMNIVDKNYTPEEAVRKSINVLGTGKINEALKEEQAKNPTVNIRTNNKYDFSDLGIGRD